MDNFFDSRKKGFLLRISTTAGVDMRPVMVADIVHVINIQWARRAIRISSREVNAGLFQSFASGGWKGESVLPGLDDVDDARINRSGCHVAVDIQYPWLRKASSSP